MRLPFSWIRLHLPAKETPEIVAEKLTQLGIEVDKIHEEGGEKVFEISLTPNLGHAWCMLGVTRELKALVDVPFTPPAIVSLPPKGGLPFELSLKVREDVPFYAARRVSGLKNGESPTWLKKTLEQCGLQSINLIVDVMNYVMMELGQPLHAFDASYIKNGIDVRFATKGENFVALDGKTYELSPHHLIIADQEKVLALAGVIGGEVGSVSLGTTDIIIEAAHFNPSVVRKQAKELGFSTEASKRFERGIDPQGVENALDRAVMLLEEIVGTKGLSDIVKVEHTPYRPKKIHCRLSRIESLLGLHLGVEQVGDIFKRLDMAYSWDGKDTFVVTPPSFRNDINEEIDLVEEVAKIFGLQNLPKKEARFSLSTVPHAPIFLLEREARQNLLGLGLQEWMCCDLIDPKKLALILNKEEMPGEPIHVVNPSSVELSVLRPSLLPGLMMCALHNYDKGNHDLACFEVGKIHFKRDEHMKEELMAAVLLSGHRFEENWSTTKEEVDFYDIKGIAEGLLSGMNVSEVTFKPHHHSLLHPGRQAAIMSGERLLGVLGEVHPSLLRKLDYPQRMYVLELSLHELYPLQKLRARMSPLPVFPSSTRDWTITLDKGISFETMEKAIQRLRPPHLESFDLKAIFVSDKLGADKQNVTFHFVYRGKEETLPQEVVDQEHNGLVDQLQKEWLG